MAVIHESYSRFRALHPVARSNLQTQFRRTQPTLAKYLAEQDRAIFGTGGGKIVSLGYHFWTVFLASGAKMIPVSEDALTNLLKAKEEFTNRLEKESEFRAFELLTERVANHPQPFCMAFADEMLREKGTDPVFARGEIIAASLHVDIAVRSLDDASTW